VSGMITEQELFLGQEGVKENDCSSLVICVGVYGFIRTQSLYLVKKAWVIETACPFRGKKIGS